MPATSRGGDGGSAAQGGDDRLRPRHFGLPILISMIIGGVGLSLRSTRSWSTDDQAHPTSCAFSERPGGPDPIIEPVLPPATNRHGGVGLGHAGRAFGRAQPEEPARRAWLGGEQDQPRFAQLMLSSAQAPVRPRLAAVGIRACSILEPEADRLARPRHQALRPHA